MTTATESNRRCETTCASTDYDELDREEIGNALRLEVA